MQILFQSFRRFIDRGTAQECSKLFLRKTSTPPVTELSLHSTPGLARGTSSTSESIALSQGIGEPTRPSQTTVSHSQSLIEPSQIPVSQSQSLLEPSNTIFEITGNAACQLPGDYISSDQADTIPQFPTTTGLQSPQNALAAPLSTIRDIQTSNESSPAATRATDIESHDSNIPSEELCTRSQEVDCALKFIADRVESTHCTQHLVRVTKGSIEALQQPLDFYKMLWSGNDNVFAGGESDSKLCRLYRGRKKIDKFHQQYECASRLSLVFLAHDIEVTKSRDWRLGPGQSRQYAAVLWIAHHLGVSPEDIKDEWRRSQNYLRLLEVCGPGILLELGTGVNW